MSALRVECLTLLLVDVVDSTALKVALGYDRGEQLLASSVEALALVVATHDGNVIGHTGDGLLAAFRAACIGLDAAAEMHRVTARLNEVQHLPLPLRVRVAVAASDAVIVDREVRGAAAIEVARAEKHVPAGETWCTEAVRLLARGRGAHEFQPRGAVPAKGLSEPLVLHKVVVPLADQLGMPEALDNNRRFEFVGRALELAQLRKLWGRATEGHGGFAVVAGEPGIGKTRLCRELARSVYEQGAVVLHGRSPAGAAPAYAPFAQMLRRVLERVADAGAVLGDGADELVRIVPEIGKLLAVNRPLQEDPSTDRYRLFEAVVQWLTRLAARNPVLLVLDDLSWADEATVELLQHVTDAIPEQPILVLASFRTMDARPAAKEMVRRLTDRIALISLSGLGSHDVSTFVERFVGGRLDASGTVAISRVGNHVGGNPLYLGEVIPGLLDGGVLLRSATGEWSATRVDALPLAPGVADLIRQRVYRLSETCREVLLLASVVGFEFRADVLVELVDRAALVVATSLDEAIEANVVLPTASAGSFEFTHSLMWQAVYEGMSPLRRQAEHLRVGEAIERIASDQLDDWLSALAYQFEQSLGRPAATKAIAYLRQAGKLSDSRLAYDHAASYYERAVAKDADSPGVLSAVERCDLLIELGTAQRRSGMDTARKTLLDATRIALDLGEVDRATRAVLGAGRGVFSVAGAVEPQRVQALRDTLTLAGPAPTVQRARLLATLSSELAFDRDPRNAEVPSDEALAIARASGDPGLLVTVLGLRLIGLWRPDRVSVRLDHAAELEAICRMAGDARRGKFLSAMTMCCQAVMEAGDLVSADRLLAWIEETAGTLKQPTSLGYAKLRLASRACIAGRFEEAEQLADEAYFYCAKSGQPDAAAFHTGQIFTIRLHQGRTDEVIDRMALAFRDHPGIETFAAGEAFCAADLGDAARCRRALVPVLAALGDLRFDLNWLATLGLASRAVHFLGDRDAAARIKRMIEPYRNLYIDNASAFFGSALHSFAVLSSMEVSDSDDIVRSFDRARAAHDSLKSPPWQARTLVEYARYMRTSGHPDRARELAEGALELGRDYALAWVAAEAASLLAALADTSTR